MSHLKIVASCGNPDHAVEHTAHPTSRNPVEHLQQMAPAIQQAYAKKRVPCPQCGGVVSLAFSHV